MSKPVETANITRPEDLAHALGMKNGKVLRSFLRATFPRPKDAKGTTWILTEAQVASAVKHFTERQSSDEPAEG